MRTSPVMKLRTMLKGDLWARHAQPFRAEWDPKDPSERLVVVGRCAAQGPSLRVFQLDFRADIL